jgi:hypothetical protein
VELLAAQDDVFTIDLTPETMEACRVVFFDEGCQSRDGTNLGSNVIPDPPERPIHAVALIFSWAEEPMLLSIEPTKDTQVLDAMARLIRAAMLTGQPISTLVTENGDEEIQQLYFAHKLPSFIYDGIPKALCGKVPVELRAAFGRKDTKKHKIVLE